MLETLVSQAYGKKMYQLCGLNLNRHLLLVSLIFIPISVLLWNSEKILLYLGQDSEPAMYCQLYIRAAMPGLFLNCISLSLTIFLTAMENSVVPMVIQGALIVLHICNTFLMEVVFDQGFIGIAYASNMTHLMTVCMYWAYLSGNIRFLGKGNYKKILRPVDREVFRNVNVFI